MVPVTFYYRCPLGFTVQAVRVSPFAATADVDGALWDGMDFFVQDWVHLRPLVKKLGKQEAIHYWGAG